MTEGNIGSEPFAAFLEHIESEHAGERELCDLLERIADSLPGSVDRLLATAAIDMLRPGLKRHALLYERFLLPMLVKRADSGDNVEALTAQVRAEDAADECLAHDIADQLEQAVESGRAENAGMLGYMLYCFFESRRRHLKWEEIVIVPLAKRRLCAEDWCGFSPEEFQELLPHAPGFKPVSTH